MSTEKKTISNLEITEPPKPKHLFKFDKKYLQGFVAGILLCAIAFAGLYYGTDGRFFSGTVSGKVLVVTDANFEKEVLQSNRYVIVAYNANPSENRGWEGRVLSLVKLVEEVESDKLIVVELDPDKSPNAMKKYRFPKGPYDAYYVPFSKGVMEDYCIDTYAVQRWINFKRLWNSFL